MILVATFVEAESGVGFDLVQGVLGASISVVDIFAIKFALSYDIFSRSNLMFPTRILGCALGWAGGQALVLHTFPLWMGARKTEFDWAHSISSVQASVNFVLILGFVRSVWLWNRRDIAGSFVYAVYALLSFYIFLPVLQSYLSLSADVGDGVILSFNIILAIVYHFTTSLVQSYYLKTR
eukprot:CAMPEP_0119121882 /NCGR_PEP_ID=MMETSP1310-20130426/2301_1 /TAXON_ID=464262 /ORGANISM="Genus nov. species nov., Strain RCC2339" /LENGTH=179 /DNA_ID=CAMNT_0007111463 /DNA_START=217 /DNA_END=756 /DNA_ORIENTATION=+